MSFRRALAALVLLGGLTPLWSEAKTFPRFFSSAGTFFTVGSANEYVYSSSTGTGLTSQLTWPIPISAGAWTLFGAKLDSNWDVSVRYQGAQALLQGDMTDQDWNIHDGDGNLITHQQSVSTAYLNSNWEFRAEAGCTFPFWEMDVRPLAGVFYHQYYWEAWNGTLTVTPATSAAYTSQWYGTSATYRQEWVVPYLGVEVRKDFHSWAWGGALRVSPFLLSNNTDEHVLRQITFTDNLWGGFMVEPSVDNEWEVFPNVRLVGDLSLRLIFAARGNETATQNGTSTAQNYTFTGYGGADVLAFTASLGLKAAY
jgi:plasminogen activator